MKPQPRPEPTPPEMTKLPTARELAAKRLGRKEGLAVLEKDTRQLAEYYLDRAGIVDTNPDTQTTAFYLAITRRDQHLLLTQVEEDLYQMVLDGKADTPAMARMKFIQNGRHEKIHREIRRLHVLAGQLYEDLLDAASTDEPGP